MNHLLPAETAIELDAFRFAKIASVTSGNRLAASVAGFHLWLGGGVALWLHSRRHSALRFTFPACRPQTEAIQERFDHALALSKLTQHIE
jgi:hypothetical protein